MLTSALTYVEENELKHDEDDVSRFNAPGKPSFINRVWVETRTPPSGSILVPIVVGLSIIGGCVCLIGLNEIWR